MSMPIISSCNERMMFMASGISGIICKIPILGRVLSYVKGVISLVRMKAEVRKCYKYEAIRFLEYSGACNGSTRSARLAKIIKAYHVIEKGLTMPNRRLAFGKDAVLRLMRLVTKFESKYGRSDRQVAHAAGVVVEYWNMHKDKHVLDPDLEDSLRTFSESHGNKVENGQIHTTKELFYKESEASFGRFAYARHSLRHYSNRELTVDRLAKAVELAVTTPSACNRQCCCVRCVCDKSKIAEILAIQNGCRGFGHLADKLLLVTSDLSGSLALREHNDVYVNGGMFLMNLCYALYYNKIAHCILNWSKLPDDDMALRKIVRIKPSETVVAVVVCGEPPDEFDVAASPRKTLSDIFIVDEI